MKHGRAVCASEIIRHLLLGWLVSAFVGYITVPSDIRGLSGLHSLAEMSFQGTLAGTFALAAVLFAAARRYDLSKYERAAVTVIFSVLSVVSLCDSFSVAFLAACLILIFILAVYTLRGSDTIDSVCKIKSAHMAFAVAAAVLALVFFLFVSLWTVCRVYSFATPTFDFGIFSQMFYNMKESGLPITTLERDGALSHFNVHVSPAYYLLLPFYMLIPKPETLQVLQAAVLASSVIPLYMIGKRHGLTGLQRTLLCALLLVYPAFSGGTSYDIHENCLLAPLILWVLYGVERKNILIISVFSFLTLTVKEDAAVYAAVVGLYIMVSSLIRGAKKERRMLITGIAVTAVSIVWFLAVTGYLSNVGDGVMSYRYKNFMYDGSSSLMTVVKAVIMSPMKAVFECVDKEKLSFILLTTIPLLGLPLITRKYERFILIIPYLLINLMSDYQYQHDIFFQYTFGSTAFLFYLTAVNLSDIKGTRIRVSMLIAACIVGGSLFTVQIIPKAEPYITNCCEKGEYYRGIRNALSVIPDGASVAATTYYTAYLSDREVLYDIKHSSDEHILECEYVALAHNSTSSYKRFETVDKSGYDAFCAVLTDNGYEAFHELKGVLTIFRKTEKQE